VQSSIDGNQVLADVIGDISVHSESVVVDDKISLGNLRHEAVPCEERVGSRVILLNAHCVLQGQVQISVCVSLALVFDSSSGNNEHSERQTSGIGVGVDVVGDLEIKLGRVRHNYGVVLADQIIGSEMDVELYFSIGSGSRE